MLSLVLDLALRGLVFVLMVPLLSLSIALVLSIPFWVWGRIRGKSGGKGGTRFMLIIISIVLGTIFCALFVLFGTNRDISQVSNLLLAVV